MANYYYASDSATTSATATTWYYAYPYYVSTGYQTSKETETEKQARLQREETYRQEQLALVKRQKEAAERAELLLKEHIGVDTYGELYRVGYIHIDSQKHKGRTYRMFKNPYARIHVIENGKVVDELCLVADVQCPDGDRLLTKKVLLESDEDYALATSNHFPRR